MNISEYIDDIVDFPKPGIVFKDICPLLANPQAFDYVCEQLATKISGAEKIVALDARWFLFGWAVANMLEIPLVPLRKAGKLPGKVDSISYDLEYGSNTFEIQSGIISQGEKVAILDDLLATGWSLEAACKLVEWQWGIVDTIQVVIELEWLWGRKKLKEYSIENMIAY